jgi:hypothetical protein
MVDLPILWLIVAGNIKDNFLLVTIISFIFFSLEGLK